MSEQPTAASGYPAWLLADYLDVDPQPGSARRVVVRHQDPAGHADRTRHPRVPRRPPYHLVETPVQWVLAIPQPMTASALRSLWEVLILISLFTVLFTERIPRSLFDMITTTYRYDWRAFNYALFLQRGQSAVRLRAGRRRRRRRTTLDAGHRLPRASRPLEAVVQRVPRHSPLPGTRSPGGRGVPLGGLNGGTPTRSDNIVCAPSAVCVNFVSYDSTKCPQTAPSATRTALRHSHRPPPLAPPSAASGRRRPRAGVLGSARPRR
jgi:hypothetical protein